MASEPDTSGGRPRSAAAPGTDAGPSARPVPRGRLGRIVTGSVAGGLVTALGLAAVPVMPAHEEGVTGAVLLGFAAGWAMLAALSTRFTASPQRWAAVPAAFTGLGGTLLLAFGAGVHPALDRVWPVVAFVLAGWAARHVHRLPSRGGRAVLWPVVALWGIASVGAAYQSVGEADDAAHSTMPGQLVDVGGHRLHLVCTGSGSPTVVLEPGAGAMAANLGWITPSVARTTRVCAYDRAGRGWSDPTDTPRNGARIADDLHTLLHRAGVPGPYVLAGHSFGGLYALAFAARYPDEVAGLVLIDSTAPAPGTGPAAASGDGEAELLTRVGALLSTTARLGVSRLYARLAFGDLPAQARSDVRTSIATSGTVRSTIDEYVAGSVSVRDAAALHSFGDRPLLVLTAGTGHAASWFVAQDHLATLSTDAVHRVIDGATHDGLIAEPQYAAVTTQAITDVVSSVRAAHRVAG
jgi:pimeloyl-ACP methyl ester carboxylesterase